MRKNVNFIFVLFVVVLSTSALVVSILAFAQFKKSPLDTIESKIAEIESDLKNTTNVDTTYLLTEVNELKEQFEDLKKYTETFDKDKIIFNYQETQKSFDNKFNIYLGVIGAIYMIFIGTSIAIPLFSRRELSKIVKETKKLGKNQKENHKKNIAIEELESILRMYRVSNKDKSLINYHLEKTEELMSKYKLNDFEKYTYLSQQANDLFFLDDYDNSEKLYDKSCEYVKKTGSKSMIAEFYYTRAIRFNQMSKFRKSLESINESVRYFPKNVIYIQYRMELYRKLILESSDNNEKEKYFQYLYEDALTSSKTNRESARSLISDYYCFINRHYSNSLEKEMRWVTKELDNYNSGKSDIRTNQYNKINQEFFKLLEHKKQEEYLSKGYADLQTKDNVKNIK